jgi:hypothetical protein
LITLHTLLNYAENEISQHDNNESESISVIECISDKERYIPVLYSAPLIGKLTMNKRRILKTASMKGRQSYAER